jgi:hypothetical protein
MLTLLTLLREYIQSKASTSNGSDVTDGYFRVTDNVTV